MEDRIPLRFRMDVVAEGLSADMGILLARHARHLVWRQVFLPDYPIRVPPEHARLEAVPLKTCLRELHPACARFRTFPPSGFGFRRISRHADGFGFILNPCRLFHVLHASGTFFFA